MKYLYKSLLDPDLYDNPKTSRFIETLLEPEIDTASDFQITQLIKNIMPIDDISSVCDRLYEHAQKQIIETGSCSPAFYAILDKENQIKLTTQITTKEQIEDFLSVGKALGFTRTSQCIFFTTMQPIHNNKPANEVNEDTPWGVMVIGSSLRGNCFVRLSEVKKINDIIKFEVIDHKIAREGQYSYFYNRFFYIRDEVEMSNIIKQIYVLSEKSSLNHKQILINFATTLKALDWFKYNS